MLALPLISLAVFLVVLVCIILCLLCRPSAKRTVTLRAIHLQQNISSAESSFFATIIFLLHYSGIAQHSTDSTLGEGVVFCQNCLLQTFPFSFQKGKKKNSSETGSSETANPIYMWMVQPKEETGLKEGRRHFTEYCCTSSPYQGALR